MEDDLHCEWDKYSLGVSSFFGQGENKEEMTFDGSKAHEGWVEFFQNPETWFSKDWTNSQLDLQPRSLKSRYLDTRSQDQLITQLKQCCKLRDLENGQSLHRDAFLANLHTNVYVAATLITMYSRCRDVLLAKEAFDAVLHKDVVVWNSLIQAYLENGKYSLAMETFTSMDVDPDSVTFTAVLKACGRIAGEKESEKQACLDKGTILHKQIKDRGLDTDTCVGNTLLGMYSKCGCLQRAREVFDGMLRKDVVSWTSLIQGYVDNDEHRSALQLFMCMDCHPDSFTFAAAIKACGGLAWLEQGIEMHKQVRKLGLDSDVVVCTTLLDMYAKCGSMKHARDVFDRMARRNVVTWTSLMLGYVGSLQYSAAMETFTRMDCEPDSHAYVAVLKACGKKALTSLKQSEREFCLKRGISIHERLKLGPFRDDRVVATTLVDMYCNCGDMRRAREVFDGIPEPNVFTWTALILGYVENGESLEAMDMFTGMDCKPDCLTYVAALKACGRLTALPAGKHIHAEICKSGLEQAQVVGNALLDFYARCASSGAKELFNAMQAPDVVSWNSLMAVYSSLGGSSRVFDLARGMEEAGVQMDGITFTCILTACSHAGRLKEGKLYFRSMVEYGLRSSIEHYNCIVDLLGRGNRLQEALCFINGMALRANGVTWITLLGACRKWKNVEVGRVAFDALLRAGTKRSAAYVLMSDIYASVGMWREMEELDTERNKL